MLLTPKLQYPLVPKLQLGNAERKAPALRTTKQVGAWKLESEKPEKLVVSLAITLLLLTFFLFTSHLHAEIPMQPVQSATQASIPTPPFFQYFSSSNQEQQQEKKDPWQVIPALIAETTTLAKKGFKNEQALLAHINKAARVKSVAFSPNGLILASGDENGIIKLWQVKTGKLLKILKGHKASINSISFSHNGRLLLSGSGGVRNDNSIRLWEIKSGKLLKILNAHRAKVVSVSFSANDKLLASGSYDKTIKLWEVDSGKLLNTLKGHKGWITSIVFSPNGKLLASADDTIKIWQVNNSKLLRTIKAHKYNVASLTFSPDGKLLASGSDNAII